jgi:hypothetical protein
VWWFHWCVVLAKRVVANSMQRKLETFSEFLLITWSIFSYQLSSIPSLMLMGVWRP